uniref:Pre-mRNA-splicing factor 38 n=1 Tax=Tetraselmis sp. GSL018 TaxID=582737 RepID=A0A061RVA8_9CHLO
MEVYGNKQTFNFEEVLRKNIVDSDYFRSIQAYQTWTEVIDEIYETVESVEPWLTGNARGPSTAFCCLFKLCSMKLSRREINDTLSHPDSPYIRAVGFLLLRYICNPKEIWSWVSSYVDDPEEFKPSPYGASITMGAFLRDLLLSQVGPTPTLGLALPVESWRGNLRWPALRILGASSAVAAVPWSVAPWPFLVCCGSARSLVGGGCRQ